MCDESARPRHGENNHESNRPPCRFDLWAVHPKKYEGRDIEPGDIPEGHSHFGGYFANGRAKMKAQDPLGHALIEKFFPPYLTYTPELPEDFSGTFSMELDPDVAYTYKSQHLRSATLTGSRDANLTGNRHDNVLTGNAGNNVLKGGAGSDELDGGGRGQGRFCRAVRGLRDRE